MTVSREAPGARDRVPGSVLRGTLAALAVGGSVVGALAAAGFYASFALRAYDLVPAPARSDAVLDALTRAVTPPVAAAIALSYGAAGAALCVALALRGRLGRLALATALNVTLPVLVVAAISVGRAAGGADLASAGYGAMLGGGGVLVAVLALQFVSVVAGHQRESPAGPMGAAG